MHVRHTATGNSSVGFDQTPATHRRRRHADVQPLNKVSEATVSTAGDKTFTDSTSTLHLPINLAIRALLRYVEWNDTLAVCGVERRQLLRSRGDEIVELLG